MSEFTKKFCRDVFGKDSEAAYRIVKPAVDGYIAAQKRPFVEEKLTETAIYFVSDRQLHTQTYDQAGSIEDKRELVIEELERVYGKA